MGLIKYFTVALIMMFCEAVHFVSERKRLALYFIFIPLTAAYIGEAGFNYMLLALIGIVGTMLSLKRNEEKFWLMFVLSLVLIGVQLFIVGWLCLKVPVSEAGFAAGGLVRFLGSVVFVSFNSLLITVSVLLGGKVLCFFRSGGFWNKLRTFWRAFSIFFLFVFILVEVHVTLLFPEYCVLIMWSLVLIALACFGNLEELRWGFVLLFFRFLGFAFSLIPCVPFLYLALKYLALNNIPAGLSLLLIAFFLILMVFVFRGSACHYEGEARRDEEKKCEIKFKNSVLSVAGMSAVLLRYNGGYTEKAQELFCKYFEENYGDKELYKEEHFKEAEKRLVSLMNMRNLNFKKYCLEVNRNMSYEGKVGLMRLLFDIAVLDGGIYPEERNLLHQIMVHIRISEEDAQLLTNMYSRYFYESRASYERSQGTYTSSGSYVPSRLVEAYAKLGLKPGTCLDEVKRVYRRLVFENHPDRLVGADEATRAAANERIREVNRAMSVITEYAS